MAETSQPRQIPIRANTSPFGFELLEAYQVNLDQGFPNQWHRVPNETGAYLEVLDVAQSTEDPDTGMAYTVGDALGNPYPTPSDTVVALVEEMAFFTVGKAAIVRDSNAHAWCKHYGQQLGENSIMLDVTEKALAKYNFALKSNWNASGTMESFADLIEAGVYLGVEAILVTVHPPAVSEE